MNKFVFLFALFVASSLASAEENHMRLIKPKGTELKLLELKRDTDLFAKFNGKTWISGTFVAEWPEKVDGEDEIFNPQYLIIPDATSIAKLPYFRFKDATYLNNYPIKTIDLENGETALNLTANKRDATRFLEHEINKIEVTGKFLIESYIVGVECDSPWARANLVKFKKPNNPSSNLKAPDGC
jgi:hypothetical protein